MSLLGGLDCLHRGLKLPVCVLVVAALRVSLRQEQLALLSRGLVQLDEGYQDGHPDAEEPALACATSHLRQVEACQELDLDQHCQVVKEPVTEETKTGQNLQVLLKVGGLSSTDCLDLYVLVKGLKEAEELPSDTHVVCSGREAGKVRLQ